MPLCNINSQQQEDVGTPIHIQQEEQDRENWFRSRFLRLRRFRDNPEDTTTSTNGENANEVFFLKVGLKTNQTSYLPGSCIQGTVSFFLPRPTNASSSWDTLLADFTGVHLLFEGNETVDMLMPESIFQESIVKVDKQIIGFHNHKNSPTNHTVFLPGHHEYDFFYKLPQDLPSSMICISEDDNRCACEISYSITAYFKRRNSNSTCRTSRRGRKHTTGNNSNDSTTMNTISCVQAINIEAPSSFVTGGNSWWTNTGTTSHNTGIRSSSSSKNNNNCSSDNNNSQNTTVPSSSSTRTSHVNKSFPFRSWFFKKRNIQLYVDVTKTNDSTTCKNTIQTVDRNNTNKDGLGDYFSPNDTIAIDIYGKNNSTMPIQYFVVKWMEIVRFGVEGVPCHECRRIITEQYISVQDIKDWKPRLHTPNTNKKKSGSERNTNMKKNSKNTLSQLTSTNNNDNTNGKEPSSNKIRIQFQLNKDARETYDSDKMIQVQHILKVDVKTKGVFPKKRKIRKTMIVRKQPKERIPMINMIQQHQIVGVEKENDTNTNTIHHDHDNKMENGEIIVTSTAAGATTTTCTANNGNGTTTAPTTTQTNKFDPNTANKTLPEAIAFPIDNSLSVDEDMLSNCCQRHFLLENNGNCNTDIENDIILSNNSNNSIQHSASSHFWAMNDTVCSSSASTALSSSRTSDLMVPPVQVLEQLAVMTFITDCYEEKKNFPSCR